MNFEVVTWDCSAEPPPSPETWMEVRRVLVCGGSPHVIATDGRDQWRHSADGRVWKMVAL